jgi:hypothetical protein
MIRCRFRDAFADLLLACSTLALPVSCSGGSSSSDEAQPAFPGAQGFGANSKGGRGGVVIEVTNLNDTGPGSLRDAVMAVGPRIVVFRVDGIIVNESPLKIEQPYVTIAGQTAPGGGITIGGEEIRVQTHDVVIRHLRIRTGDVVPPVDGWDNRDALNFGTPYEIGGAHDGILDHCSLSWSVDEVFSTWYGTHDVTVQNCILSEGLYHNQHPEGPHSMSVLIGDGSARISMHHNLIAHCNGRNPQFAGTDGADFRNNVVYNWGEYAALFKSPGDRINFICNHYKAGPDYGTAWSPSAVKLHTDVTGLLIYIDGNIDPVCPTGTEDNWDMVVWLSGLPVLDRSMRLPVPLPYPAVTTKDAESVVDDVLADAGAIRPERDSIDQRIVNDVVNGTGGIIDSEMDIGGWVDMWKGSPPADSDHDGMPDAWELSHGLDPDSPDDGALDRDGDGYTNVEEYLNSLTP